MKSKYLTIRPPVLIPVLFILVAPGLGYSADESAGSIKVNASRNSPLLDDPFSVSLGTFLLTTKTKISIDGTGGNSGTVIDTKKDLGFKDADRFRLDATWRFAPNHKVRAMYFSISQSNTQMLDRDITVGDTVYPVNVEVTAKNSTSVYELAYEYSFLRRDNYEITASAGLHAIDFGFSLSGVGTVNGQTGQARTETAGVTAPLPVFGLRGLWEIAPKWYVDAQAQYFALKIDNIDGRITDLRAGVTYMPGRHWGVGAGYNRFVTTVGVNKNAFDGQLKWNYSGAQVFVTASF
ncbi:MAG: hypothetical protein RL030_1539 [Pseudomonadota bacterium]|jgi:hypothetical protein